MASKVVSDAVEARLAANFSRCPVFGRNAQSEPPTDGTPFLVVQYPVANESHVGMAGVGNRVFREEGGFRLVLYVERSLGVTQGLTWIEELRDLFRAQQFSGVNCWAPSPPTEDNSNENGNYYLLSTAIPYYRDLLA